MKRKRILVLSLILALTLNLFAACIHITSEKTFNMKAGMAQFSMQYKSTYKIVDSTEFTLKTKIGSVTFKGVGRNTENTYIKIIIWQTDADVPNARAHFEMIIDKWGDQPDFKLVEESEVIISGIPAKLIAYQERDLVGAIAGMYSDMIHENTTTRIMPMHTVRETCFDYNNLIWSISVDSSLENEETARVDYEYILQTFKILN